MNTAVLRASLGPGWRRALGALVLLWLATLWIHRETLLAMVAIWDRSETFAHAWVVPPITAWLVWRLRHQALAQVPRPVPWLLVLLVTVGLLWLLGSLAAVGSVMQLALVAMLVLSVPALLGWDVARVLMFPLGFVFFCVPIGEFMTPSLMNWTASITVAALRASGIPVYQQGLQFVIPSGNWSVVEACSGIRYLIASVMVGTLFAYLNYQSMKRRLIFVGVSIIVPLAANWLRAYMIVMLGHLSGNTLAVGADHLVYGWVLFGIIIMILYWIGARWAEPMDEPAPAQSSAAPWPATGMVTGLLALLVVALPLLAVQRLAAVAAAPVPALVLPAQLPGGWQRADMTLPDWPAGFVNPSATVRGEYRSPRGDSVAVEVFYYRQQGEQRKLISSVNRMVGGEFHLWNLVSTEAGQALLADGVLPLRDGHVLQQPNGSESGGRRLRFWQSYWVDGRFTASLATGKLLTVWSQLRGQGDDGAALQLVTDDADPEAARLRLGRFATDAVPALSTWLQGVRQTGAAH